CRARRGVRRPDRSLDLAQRGRAHRRSPSRRRDAPPARQGGARAGAQLRSRTRRELPVSGVEIPAWRSIASVPWLCPALEVVHIIGIALLVGSLVLVEIGIWGRGGELPLAPLARFGLRLTLVGFGIAA